MSSLAAVTAWMDKYRAAWTSNDPAQVGDLFAEDAAYFPEPYAAPWRGRQEIVERWLDRKDEPGQAEFRWHLLAVTPEVAVVQGETSYPIERHTYSNLWVIRLDADGRCAEFAEWWMRHPAPDEPAGLSDPP